MKSYMSVRFRDVDLIEERMEKRTRKIFRDRAKDNRRREKETFFVSDKLKK